MTHVIRISPYVNELKKNTICDPIMTIKKQSLDCDCSMYTIIIIDGKEICHHNPIETSIVLDRSVHQIQHYRNRSVSTHPSEFIKRNVEYGKMSVHDDNLRLDSMRINTLKEFFVDFTVMKGMQSYVDKLAKAGFYKNPEDFKIREKVRCLYCQGTISIFHSSDNPMKLHKKCYPTCPFVLKLNVGNKRSKPEFNKKEHYDFNESNGKPGLYPIKEGLIEVRPKLNIENNNVNELFERSLIWRELSFENYPEIKHLSKYGVFIHENAGQNYAKCFNCGKDLVLLPGYETLKSSTFHRNTCSYHNKQLEMNIDVNNKSEKHCRVEYNIMEDEIDARIDSPQVIKMSVLFNLDQQKVRNHVENQLRSKGMDFRSSYELIWDVFHNEIKDIKYEDHLKHINKEMCVVCLDSPATTLYLPCGHLRVCSICSNQLCTCPVCRTIVERKISGIRLNKW